MGARSARLQVPEKQEIGKKTLPKMKVLAANLACTKVESVSCQCMKGFKEEMRKDDAKLEISALKECKYHAKNKIKKRQKKHKT